MCAQGQALHFLGGLTVNELRGINQGDADLHVAKLFGISLAHSILLRNINDSREGAPSCVIRNPEQVLGDQAQTVFAFWRHLDRMTPEAWEAAREAAEFEAWENAMGVPKTGVGAAAKAATKAAVGAEAWEAAREAARGAAWEAAWEAARASIAAAEATAEAAAKAAVRPLPWEAAKAAAEATAKAAARAAARAAVREAVGAAVGAAAGATNEIQGAAFMRANNQPFVFLPLFGFPDPESVIASSWIRSGAPVFDPPARSLSGNTPTHCTS